WRRAALRGYPDSPFLIHLNAEHPLRIPARKRKQGPIRAIEVREPEETARPNTASAVGLDRPDIVLIVAAGIPLAPDKTVTIVATDRGAQVTKPHHPVGLDRHALRAAPWQPVKGRKRGPQSFFRRSNLKIRRAHRLPNFHQSFLDATEEVAAHAIGTRRQM